MISLEMDKRISGLPRLSTAAPQYCSPAAWIVRRSCLKNGRRRKHQTD
ncbi:Uncharacterized protein ChrSV_3728 [Chromobacterium vaccinii]|nr:Uncharacterized protein ChrSW_3728 [Chromobacterium vaccinii]QND91185.1 Uncharacterized protein ChrSV_3728 [Chromobacterium vaccinii]